MPSSRNSSSKKVILFDLDGTLYDKSRLPIRLAASQLLRGRLGMLSRERKARKTLKGRDFGSEEAFYTALFDAIGPKARTWYFQGYMPAMVRTLRRHYRLRPWVQELLPALRAQGARVVVYSDYGCVREKLEALGFDLSWADAWADAPSYGGLKPASAPLLRLLDRLSGQWGMSLAPADCVMVGDRPDTDGALARAAGMRYVPVTGALPPAL